MTISGKLTQRQRTIAKLVKVLAPLALGVGGFWAFAAPALRHSPLNDPYMIALVALFPVAGVVAYGLVTWISGSIIVEFRCDESALTYRKAWSTRARTRPLSDVVKVEEAHGGYYGLTLIGYQVRFRNGEGILLGRRLPNAKELADWLSAHRQPPPPATSGSAGFLKSVFGKMEYIAVSSPKIEGRVRGKYGSEIATLADLGFNYRCCYAEAFSIFKLALVIPALAILSMRLQGEVVRIGRGLKVMGCYPLLISGDSGTYAHASVNGVKLHTQFLDGTALVSAMNPRLDEFTAPAMTKRCGAASIPQLWSAHQGRIEAFESKGKQVDRHISLQTYFRLQEMEDALL